jgi:hypothetical protein
MSHTVEELVGEGIEARIERAERQASYNAYADGLADVAVGLLFLAIAGLFAVERYADAQGPLAHVSALGLPLVIVVMLVGIRAVLPRVQARVSLPRAGYVVLPRRDTRWSRGAAGLLAVAVGAAAVIAVFAFPDSMRWLPIGQGLAVGGILALVGRGAGAPRFYVLAAVSVLAGIVVARADLDDPTASMAFYAVVGMAAVVSGIVTFGRFVRSTANPGAAT